MFQDMMNKLQETQQKVEEAKKRMETVHVSENGPENKVKVVVTAAGKVKEIDVDESLLTDSEELEDHLIITLNKALEKAKGIYDEEVEGVAKAGMPKIPGMNF